MPVPQVFAQAADSEPRPRALLPWVLVAMALHAWALWPAPEPVSKPSATPLWLKVSRPSLPSVPSEAPPPALPTATRADTKAPPNSPHRSQEPAPEVASAEPLAAPASAAEGEADRAPMAPLELPRAARWAYQLEHDGVRGDAWLDWQREGDRYELVLQRRTTQRALPRWESQGDLGLQGLAPQRFAVQRGRTGLRVIHDAGGTPSAQVQDRLSWMLQLPALLQAQPDARSAELTVVDWRGRPHPWRFERVGAEPLTLADGQTRTAVHWRRTAQGQAQAEIELWMDPAEGHRPLRLVHKVLGDERWELLWNPAASGVPP